MSQAIEPSHAPETPASKFSRYRSLRGKSISAITTTTSTYTNPIPNVPLTLSRDDPSRPAAVPAPANSSATSMSRYRKRVGSVSVDNNATSKIAAPQHWEQSPMPPVPAIPATLKHDGYGLANSPFPREMGDASPIDQTPTPFSSQHHRQLRHSERGTRNLNHQASDHESHPNEEREQRRMAERDNCESRRQVEEDAATYTERVSRSEQETDRKPVTPKRKTPEILQVSLANGQQFELRSPKARSPVVEKFVALTRRRKSKEGLSPTSSTAGSTAGSLDHAYGYGHGQVEPPEVPKLPIGIEVGGRGIVPQIDAPVSAVNHGDRIVSVRCGHHTFILSVTPDTTPVDIVLETAKNMTYDLEWSPSQCIVRESYGPLGLERRLRKYERIRDVMNSWDRDTHNHLVVMASNDAGQDRDLEIDSVPDSQGPPTGVQQYIYHSNRPGKWNKRWITLTDNGQILCARKPDATASERDTISLCHLSDYDIYNPTESQMRRHLKPPKRNCFAVKSQHKPAMFMDTENYVQYFSMEDSRTATQFAQKVQRWRSWYLLDRRPAARRISLPKTDDKPLQLPFVASHASKKPTADATEGSRRLKPSADESPFNIGEFKPLIDTKHFGERISLFGKDFSPPPVESSTRPKRIPNQLKKGPKDSKSDGALIERIRSSDDEAFTGSGLLGSGYAARKASVDKEASNPRHFSKDHGDFGKDAFIGGPSLLSKQSEVNGAQKGEISWFPSALEHTAKTYREPEQLQPNTSAGPTQARPNTARTRSHSQTRLPLIPHPHPLNAHDPRAPSGAPDHSGSSSWRHQPKPLVNLTTPVVNEPPQWSSKKGHGVQAPEGMLHLVDLISVGGPTDKPNGLLEVPPRSAMRRSPPVSAPLHSAPSNTSPHRGGGSLGRTRSKSSGAPPGRPLIDDVPPVPTLPGAVGIGSDRNMTMGDADRVRMDAMREATKSRERGRARERDREQQARDEFHSTGRAGTLKVV